MDRSIDLLKNCLQDLEAVKQRLYFCSRESDDRASDDWDDNGGCVLDRCDNVAEVGRDGGDDLVFDA